MGDQKHTEEGGIQKIFKWVTKKGKISSYSLGCQWEMTNATGRGCHAVDWTNPGPTPLQFKHLRISTTVPALGIPAALVLPFTGIFLPFLGADLGGNAYPSLHKRALLSSWPMPSMTLFPWLSLVGGLQCPNNWLPPSPAQTEDNGGFRNR